MLVLSRQRGEAIMIGDAMEVTVVDIRGDKVRLGIRAPRTTSVHRKEIYEQIQSENTAAAHMQPGDIPVHASVPPPMRLVPRDHSPAAPVNRAAHAPFLQAALDEARQGLDEGGLPIGAVLVREGKIIAAGHNRRIQRGDPMAHAAIDCLTRAGRQKTYKDTVLYSTLMPCFLCGGAAVQFGIPQVVAGESVNFTGAGDFLRKHGVEVVDLHDAACIQMMSQFIREHPALWNEDTGGS